MRILTGLLALALALPLNMALAAGYKTVEWSDLKTEVYGNAELLPGDGIVDLEAPFRSQNDAEVPVSVTARMLDGRGIASVTLIIDENPMPVSAIWQFDQPRQSVTLGANMRFNGPSPLRAVVETTDGQRYITSRDVRTSGLGACSAPPVGDPVAALEGLGEMIVLDRTPASRAVPNRRMARLEMRHPQHTGMQMNQVSLHYILARYIDEVEVWSGDDKLFTLTGSISLSEDPEIEFDFPNNGADQLRVRMHDTNDTVVEKVLAFGVGS